ncbi:hypothetical protein B4V02_01930 [Paenibacillus kribbensis]|uniref:Uncharacterized protein n=1 Tax=Paenibacillus kribbensis TaxID=172713 RepID=A0A222WHS2_9BACL|nr:hypothetical protein B4V02_01930 [Paenibacillus kribbensis]
MNLCKISEQRLVHDHLRIGKSPDFAIWTFFAVPFYFIRILHNLIPNARKRSIYYALTVPSTIHVH